MLFFYCISILILSIFGTISLDYRCESHDDEIEYKSMYNISMNASAPPNKFPKLDNGVKSIFNSILYYRIFLQTLFQ